MQWLFRTYFYSILNIISRSIRLLLPFSFQARAKMKSNQFGGDRSSSQIYGPSAKMHVGPCCLLASLAFSALYSSPKPCVFINIQSFVLLMPQDVQGRTMPAHSSQSQLLWFDRTVQGDSSAGWERHGTPPRHFFLPLTKRRPFLVISV